VLTGVGHIRDSVIGREAQVSRIVARTDGHRLIVGDHDQLCIGS
jgi:hypothetical protein